MTEIDLPPKKERKIYHAINSTVRTPDKIAIRIEVADKKKYIVPLVAEATRGFIFSINITGTITRPAPAPTVPAIKPAPNPCRIREKA